MRFNNLRGGVLHAVQYAYIQEVLVVLVDSEVTAVASLYLGDLLRVLVDFGLKSDIKETVEKLVIVY